MSTNRVTDVSRRRFFAATAASLAVPAFAAGARQLRLGGPIFLKSADPVELAQEHRRLGYRAAYCPNATLDDKDRISAMERAFAAEDVVISEVGAWKNMMDQNEEQRKQNMAYVTERMALADAVGARTCVTISGSMNPKLWDGPDQRNSSKEYFEATVQNARSVIDAVKPKRSKFSLEMMPWTPPRSPEEYIRLIRAIDRPAFGVHIDMCNVISTAEQYYRNGEIIEETFRQLGKWILSCHGKDLIGQRVHLMETIPGRGGLDYPALLRAIATYAPAAPLMLEHLSKPEEYDEAKQYVLKVGQQIGISFS
jgi:sugar phosphate isomerase/epimerase